METSLSPRKARSKPDFNFYIIRNPSISQPADKRNLTPEQNSDNESESSDEETTSEEESSDKKSSEEESDEKESDGEEEATRNIVQSIGEPEVRRSPRKLVPS